MKRWLILALAAMAALSTRADGDMRPATAAERAFLKKVEGVICAALPPGPAGWTVAEKSERESFDQVSAGAAKHPMEVRCFIAWKDQARLRQAQSRLLEESAPLVSQGPREEQEALMDRMNVLGEKFAAAINKNDTAEVQRIQKEMEAVGQKLRAIGEAQNQAFQSVAQKNAAKDAEAEVLLVLNSREETIPQGAVREQPIQGATVYRIEEGEFVNEAWREGTTVAFLGAWTLAKENWGTVMRPSHQPGAPGTSVQNVFVRVQADKVRARKLLEGVDWASLKGLMAAP
ncbi:MAG: hypothetical protein ACOYXN_09240 [Acidobacteriota bacterium]